MPLGVPQSRSGTAIGGGSRDPPFEAERRQLTVMFCDLVGSTAISAQLDPEDLREIIRSYQETCAAVVDRFRGYLGRFVGDGVLVYFGYPESHEDDTERAIRAAFGIIEATSELNHSLTHYPGVELAVRIGVATGLVVVGDIVGRGATEQDAAVGQTPNLAARLQGAAEPNSIVIDSHTQQLLGDQFEYEHLAPHKFSGFSEPIVAWRVIQPLQGVTRFEAMHRKGVVPLVGREEKINRLLECWRSAKSGRGQCVLVAGEAGIGKSRLAESLSERLTNEQHVELRYQCHSYCTSSAFHPIIDQLERTALIHGEDKAEQRLAKLQQLVANYQCDPEEVVPLLAALLSIPTTNQYPPLRMSPRQQKERTLAGLVNQILGGALHEPVLVLFEDVHWIDPSSRELLDIIWKQIRTSRILLLVTTREQHIPLAWSGAEHASTITLNRLDRRDSLALVAQMPGGSALPQAVLEEIVQRTDGVPLHVEELTKSILGSASLKGDQGDHCLNFPVSLQGSLMARLDQLGPQKRIAQYASVIGREFSLRLLAEVSGLTEQSLRNGLEKLVQSELVYQCGSMSDPTFIFKHAMVQEAAHESLLHSERRDLHAQTARALQLKFPQLAQTQPELLAQHYTQAADAQSAIVFWISAGQRSIERCAFVEAISHLREALNLLARLPASAERDEQELDVQMTIGGAITATSGYGALQVGQAFDRALELCRKLNKPEKLFPTLYGIGGFHLIRSELDKTRRIAEEILDHAKHCSDATPTLLGCRLLGATLFLTGDYRGARDHLNQAVALYDVDKHPAMISVNSEDYLTTGLAYLSFVNVMLGSLDQGFEASHRSLAHARQLGHLYSVAYALQFSAAMHQLRGESAAVRERSAELIDLCIEQGYPHFLGAGHTLQGWAMVDEGQSEEGLNVLQTGINEWVSLGGACYVPWGLSMLSDALAKAGMVDRALSTAIQGIELTQKSGEKWFKAELVRQRGEMLLMGGGKSAEAKAEASFQEALSIARDSSATLWELRAAMSLAQLWHGAKRLDEARALLATVYDRFTEGLDTPFLHQARQLLCD